MRITRNQVNTVKDIMKAQFPGNWTEYFILIPLVYGGKNYLGIEDEIRVTKAQALFFDIDNGMVFAIRGEYGYYGKWSHHPKASRKMGYLDTQKVFRLPLNMVGPSHGEMNRYLSTPDSMNKVLELVRQCEQDRLLHK